LLNRLAGLAIALTGLLVVAGGGTTHAQRATSLQGAVAPIPPQPQRHLVDRWTVEDGLPNNALSGVMVGRDGYLWVASLAGAWRFDGVRFTPIPQSLPNAHVRSMFEDRQGRLWLGTVGSGLARVTDGRAELFPASQLAGLDVRVLAEDASGRVWAATENGISVIDNGRVVNLRKAEGLAGNNVASLARGDGNEMWFATDGGLCLARDLQVRCFGGERAVAGRLLKGVVQESTVQDGSLLRARDGVWWVGGRGGLFSMRSDLSETGQCGRGCFVGHAVTSVLETRAGQLIAGFADGGVGIVDHGTTEIYGKSEGISPGPVVSMAEDAEGSIWVSIYNGGLERLRRRRIRMFTTADGLPAKAVGSIVQDVHGTIWSGSQCGPVSELVGGRFVQRFPEYTKGLCALTLRPSRDGSLWIGTDGGLFHWANNRMTHIGRDSGLTDLRIRALFEDRDGALWIGTLFGALHIYKDGQLSRGYTKADGVVEGQLESFAQDREGRVWIGSNGNGLSVYENGRFRILTPSEQPPDKDVTGMYIDSRGDFWVSSDRAGFFRCRNNTFEAFDVERGLTDNLVGLMLEDRAQNMWVSTARGISRLDRAAIEAVAAGRRRSLEPILIDRADGMVNPEVSGGGFDPTGLVDRDGRLWFSTIDGIVMIDPAAFPINEVPPRLAIESASIGGRAVTGLGEMLAIPAGGPPLELTYTGLSCLAPKKMRFRYRLQHFDAEWTDAGTRRTAYYPHLPPGSYVFEVLAANSDGIWSATPATMRVEVAPFWWERGSVRVVGVLLLLFELGVLVRSFTLRRAAARLKELERERALDRERSRIAQDLHDDIGARLTQLALMAERGPGGGGDVAGAARDTIQAMDELVWTVSAGNDTVESVVTYCVAYAGEYLGAANMRLRLKTPLEVPALTIDADTRRQVFLCLKEALNNVVKHSGATEVRLTIEVTSVALTLEIHDNGCGFDPSAANPTGNGVPGMQTRARAAGGQCEIVSSPGAGTTVHVHVSLPGALP